MDEGGGGNDTLNGGGGAEFVLSGIDFGAGLISNSLILDTAAGSPYSDYKIHVTDAHNFSAASWTLRAIMVVAFCRSRWNRLASIEASRR